MFIDYCPSHHFFLSSAIIYILLSSPCFFSSLLYICTCSLTNIYHRLCLTILIGASDQSTSSNVRMVRVVYQKSLKDFPYKDSLSEFLDLISETWVLLKQTKFCLENNLNAPVNDATWGKFDNGGGGVVTVLLDRLKFSDWKMNRVQQFVGVITQNDDCFVSAAPAKDEAVLLMETESVVAELVKRINCISMDSASECTMREFISPVLIGALNVIKEKEITFRAEYKIEGWSGNGPVDYDFMYKEFHVCVAEAKKEAINDGIAQNCGQIMASRDVYDISLATEKKRKRSFEPDGRTAALKSIGIVSTGTEWVFLQYFHDDGSWKFCRSNTMQYLLDSKDRDTLKKGVGAVLRRLVYILRSQIEDVDNFVSPKKAKL